MRYAAITGWGMAVPDRVLTNADLERMIETTDEWIASRTGIRERRVVGPNDSTTSLGASAARQATAAQLLEIPHIGDKIATGLASAMRTVDIEPELRLMEKHATRVAPLGFSEYPPPLAKVPAMRSRPISARSRTASGTRASSTMR